MERGRNDMPGKRLKILAIGNSFSEDATRYLYDILQDGGMEDIRIGNLYVPGCSLEQHVGYARGEERAYTYFKNTDGNWTAREGAAMAEALADEPWDWITMQQCSALSGKSGSYTPWLSALFAYVRARAGAGTRYAWHMTWAYQQGSDHPAFPDYGRDQMTMYRAICAAVQAHIVPDTRFERILPAGTAVQNARAGFAGDTLTRDGYHLSLGAGRYLAGLTWAAALGLDIGRAHTLPDGVDAAWLPPLIRAAQDSLAAPFAVTARPDPPG